jgi:hypothetical protein
MQRLIDIIIIIFAIIGIIFTGVFVAMQFGLLNVRGSIDERNRSLMNAQGQVIVDPLNLTRPILLCKIHVIADYAPSTAKNIYVQLQKEDDFALIQQMITLASNRFINNPSFIQQMNTCNTVVFSEKGPLVSTAFAWADSPEWEVMKSAFIRDQEYIRQAAKDAGISPRVLLGGVMGEQFRFFTNARDSFKQYFEPLKILASLSKFSFGIAGLKPETVKRIDEQLRNPQSVFYLGASMENIVDYPSDQDTDTVRFNRITDTKNTYYSYLYVGLFMRQVTQQWKSAGYDIADNPGVLATLYNLGFNRSIPKADPKPGGAPIVVNNQEYTFGDIAHEFYYSGELIDIFPYE